MPADLRHTEIGRLRRAIVDAIDRGWDERSIRFVVESVLRDHPEAHVPSPPKDTHYCGTFAPSSWERDALADVAPTTSRPRTAPTTHAP